MDPFTMMALASAGSGLIQGVGSWFAGDAQAEAAERAMALRREMFGKAETALTPFIQGGKGAWEVLAPLLGIGQDSGNPLTGGGDKFGELLKRFTGADLENTPGYQFTRDQGLRATQNSFAAKGLGSSGNALTGAAEYGTGLAQKTYGDEFTRHWQSNKNIFDMLFAPTQMGGQSANTLANAATQTGAGMATDATNVGNANAAAINGVAGGVGNALTGGINAYSQGQIYGPLLQAQTDYFKGRTGGTGGGTAAVASPLIYGPGY